jgi:hypothetical protein
MQLRTKPYGSELLMILVRVYDSLRDHHGSQGVPQSQGQFFVAVRLGPVLQCIIPVQPYTPASCGPESVRDSKAFSYRGQLWDFSMGWMEGMPQSKSGENSIFASSTKISQKCLYRD